MNAVRHIYAEDTLENQLPTSQQTVVAGPPICPLCGGISSVHALTDSGCEVRECNTCELFYVHPHPGTSEQHQRVASGRYPGIELLDCERRYEGECLYYDRHFDLIAQETAGATSILDVGCGTGNLLERFSSRPNCYRLGIELNPAAAAFARRVAGCEVLEVPFERFHSERKFDAITMISVFSHISSFDAMFRSLRSALAPGGHVIMRTTEMSRDVSRWNQVHWGVPDDLHFLGLNTLDYVCKTYGFAVVRHVRVPYEDELFRRSRWQQMGRVRWHNAIKRMTLSVPGALPTMRNVYAAVLGHRLFISFIVLKTCPATSGDQRNCFDLRKDQEEQNQHGKPNRGFRIGHGTATRGTPAAYRPFAAPHPLHPQAPGALQRDLQIPPLLLAPHSRRSRPQRLSLASSTLSDE